MSSTACSTELYYNEDEEPERSHINRVTSKVFNVTRKLSGTFAETATYAKTSISDSTEAAMMQTQAFGSMVKVAAGDITTCALNQTQALGNRAMDIAADPDVQVTAKGAIGGAAVVGGAASYTAAVAGAALGAVVGIPAAFFTFGASIPVCAAAGSAIGGTAGATVGGAAGLISGGAAGYICGRKRPTSAVSGLVACSSTPPKCAKTTYLLDNASVDEPPTLFGYNSETRCTGLLAPLGLRPWPSSEGAPSISFGESACSETCSTYADAGAQCDLLTPRDTIMGEQLPSEPAEAEKSEMASDDGKHGKDVQKINSDPTFVARTAGARSQFASPFSPQRAAIPLNRNAPGHDTERGYETAVAEWIAAVAGVEITEELFEALRTGEILCLLINCIQPGTIARIERPGMPFRERENISHFLKACRVLGVQEYALFSTDDLYEQRNTASVVRCLLALGGAVQRTVPDFKGPHLGHADLSKWRDTRRTIRPATQTGGLHGAMDVTRTRHVERTCSITF